MRRYRDSMVDVPTAELDRIAASAAAPEPPRDASEPASLQPSERPGGSSRFDVAGSIRPQVDVEIAHGPAVQVPPASTGAEVKEESPTGEMFCVETLLQAAEQQHVL
eukprot:COSAG02_NODE_50591_length_319_cov_1.181818_1_plen_106_part_11